MMKYTIAITLIFSTAEIICESLCPLTTKDGEIASTQEIKQMNGTWSEYMKTDNFLTNETCITYNIHCSNDTWCNVNLIQKNDKKLATTELAVDGQNTTWGEKNPFFIHVDSSKGYAILWDCHDDGNKTYNFAVLMVNISKGTTEVDTIVKSIEVTYVSEPKLLNHTTCGAVKFAISLAVVLLTLFSIIYA